MPTSINSSGITFPNGTTQTTAAAASSYVGGRGQVFTASGTFTVPTGVTAVKVTLCGGGGGAGWSGTTAGGTTSFGAYCSGSGGAASPSGQMGAGGTGTGGDLNITGPRYSGFSVGFGLGINAWAIGGTGGYYTSPTGYGSGNMSSYSDGTNDFYGVGGGGGASEKYITGLTPGGTVTVTIGAGGTGASGSGITGRSGRAGVCIIEW